MNSTPISASSDEAPGPAIRGLWWSAGLWLLAIVMGGMALTHHLLNQHRQAQLDMAQFRLASLQESLDATFNQMAALPRALSRQSAIIGFLQHTQVDGSEHVNEADRARLRQQLGSLARVKTTSLILQDTAHEFNIKQIYLLDRFGTTLADSNIDTPANVIGANYRTRRYHSEALEHGSASQFAVGRINKFPAFFFSARVNTLDETLGVLVIKQETATLDRLLDDRRLHMMVTDANGVVLMSNRGGDMLSHIPLQGPLHIHAEAQAELYHTQPKERPWRIGTRQVGHNAVKQVELEDGKRYFAQSLPLSYGELTAWALTPQEGEDALTYAVTGGGTLLLLSGWGMLLSQAQRRKRLHAVMQGQQTLRHMAHALPLTVFRYEIQPSEADGRFTFIGQGLHQMLGLTPEELHTDPTRAWRLMGTADRRPPGTPCEFKQINDGRHVWVRCESQRTLAADGTLIYNGYWADISQQHHLSEQLQSVFTNSPLAFVYYDATLSLTRCNPAAVALFGADSEADLVGLKPQRPPMSPAMDEDTLASRRHAFVSTLLRGEVAHFEWRYTRLNGTPFDAEVVAIPFVVDGQSFECAIIQDITSRKAVEAATRQAQQAAEAAARTQAQFLANMSHEIRTPMNAIMGMIHLVLTDELSPKARNYLDKAHLAANNLLQILNDVLDVSKIASGKLDMEYTGFQLESVIGHMADVLGARAEEKGLELLFTAPPDIPTALMGDPIRLGQVLVNLGTNAIKFADAGDVVVGCKVQAQNPDNVMLHFWVQDKGIGLSGEQISRLFQPFTQADSSTTRQYGGTGLGLAISRQLVELMGGQIWVDNWAKAQPSTTRPASACRPIQPTTVSCWPANYKANDCCWLTTTPPRAKCSVRWPAASGCLLSSVTAVPMGSSVCAQPWPKGRHTTSCSSTGKCRAWTALLSRATPCPCRQNTAPACCWSQPLAAKRPCRPARAWGWLG
jgi:two-component system sensor histidine kinase/response regulator